MERIVEAEPGIHLWVDDHGRQDAPPVLLIMGANASGLVWPDELVARLGQRHRVIRYDHRDTGRSTWAFDTRPYAIADLALDAVAVLDALALDRAHVVGMSMGGVLVQLLLLDHPERLLSGTLVCSAALGARTADLPGPDSRLLAMWSHMADARDLDAELDWRVEHWRLLHGDVLDFDAQEFRGMELRQIHHTGRHDHPVAHGRADPSGLDRGADLARVAVPTLVIEGPADPVNPPPHADHLVGLIGDARLVSIPGMGHALSRRVVEPLSAAILAHTARTEPEGQATTRKWPGTPVG
jgi:pimeloyl-ACP methyl ester carboxylesterase